MFYKQFMLIVNITSANESINQIEQRYNRLRRIADGTIQVIEPECIIALKKLEDNNNTLNVYWTSPPSNLNKLIINSLWMDEKEFHTNHIIISPPRDKILYQISSLSPL